MQSRWPSSICVCAGNCTACPVVAALSWCGYVAFAFACVGTLSCARRLFGLCLCPRWPVTKKNVYVLYLQSWHVAYLGVGITRVCQPLFIFYCVLFYNRCALIVGHVHSYVFKCMHTCMHSYDRIGGLTLLELLLSMPWHGHDAMRCNLFLQGFAGMGV